MSRKSTEKDSLYNEGNAYISNAPSLRLQTGHACLIHSFPGSCAILPIDSKNPIQQNFLTDIMGGTSHQVLRVAAVQLLGDLCGHGVEHGLARVVPHLGQRPQAVGQVARREIGQPCACRSEECLSNSTETQNIPSSFEGWYWMAC